MAQFAAKPNSQRLKIMVGFKTGRVDTGQLIPTYMDVLIVQTVAYFIYIHVMKSFDVKWFM